MQIWMRHVSRKHLSRHHGQEAVLSSHRVGSIEEYIRRDNPDCQPLMGRITQARRHIKETRRTTGDSFIGHDLDLITSETWIRVFLNKEFDPHNMMANIVGHEFRFLNFKTFQYMFREIFLNHTYHFVANNEMPFIIDCGSNIGMSVLYFKMIYPQSNIIAFEPLPMAYSCLRENVYHNNLSSVTVYEAALASHEGETILYYDEDNPGLLTMSINALRMPKQRRPVRSARLSQYLDREVDLVKMDIEGAEHSVIEEVANANRLRNIKHIQIEYHHHINRDVDDMSAFLYLLEAEGFGYQISGNIDKNLKLGHFQDLMIYAYRKKFNG